MIHELTVLDQMNYTNYPGRIFHSLQAITFSTTEIVRNLLEINTRSLTL